MTSLDSRDLITIEKPGCQSGPDDRSSPRESSHRVVLWRNLLLRLMLRVLLDSCVQLFRIVGGIERTNRLRVVMKIKGLSKYRGRNPHGYFQDLPWGVRQRAYAWLSRFLKRHPYCPRWRFAILVGQAKRLALMSDEERSAWGRSMHAKRGGYAVQRRYWHESRIGPDHPAHKAAQVSVAQRKWRKQERLGLLPKPGVLWI